MKKSFLSFVLFSTIGLSAYAQQSAINAELYGLYLSVNDTNDIIQVEQSAYIAFNETTDKFYLDLKSLDENGKGMVVNAITGVKENDNPVQWEHRNDSLIIFPKLGNKGTAQVYEFKFSGIPADGLIIGTNKFGDRTFFGDNWPNRAHNWFACVDHPSDKVTMRIAVEAPSHYECIATGELVQVSELEGNKIVHYYKSEIPLPPKVIVVGLADFTWKKLDHQYDFPLTVWPYEKDSMNGFRDMAIAKDVVDFFIRKIDTYPFEKLANVQSTTIFGGMENAGNIFYDENAVLGDKSMEALIAHEVAHQWFGNSASESDWQHLWLSEGFATYLTDLYWEDTYGPHAFQQRLKSERERVVGFYHQYDHPVVDTTYASLMHLLNPNSYQKGAWILHMLRQEIGDALFWEGLRHYYEQYKFSNASTADFMRAMEEIAGRKLSYIFDQWLYQAGHPQVKFDFVYRQGRTNLRFEQIQSHTFTCPIEVELVYDDETTEVKTFKLRNSVDEYQLRTDKKVIDVRLDPQIKLLFEEIK